jgi:hypothetical protein
MPTLSGSSNLVSESVPTSVAAPAPEAPVQPAAAAPPPVPTPPPTIDVAVDPGPEPPTGNVVPVVSTDWKPKPVGRGKGARAKAAQISNAVAAAKEIGGSTTYAEDFGPHAPSQALFAHLLLGASGWRGQWTSAKRWTAYAAEQNAAWWVAALGVATLLQPAFEYAIARDPTIAEKYPAAKQFIEAGSLIGKRAASVRKAKNPPVKPLSKKAAKQAAKEAAAAAQHPAGTPTPGGTTTK